MLSMECNVIKPYMTPNEERVSKMVDLIKYLDTCPHGRDVHTFNSQKEADVAGDKMRAQMKSVAGDKVKVSIGTNRVIVELVK